MKSLLLALSIVFIGAHFSYAKTEQSQASLKDKALAEYSDKGAITPTATDAQLEGMLTLKDPYEEIISRSWKYFIGFSAQSFQAEGTASKDANSYDLSASESSIMPALEVGLLAPKFKTRQVAWTLGLRAEAGFTSQSVDVVLESGYNIDDARLNSTIFSIGPTLLVQWEKFSWLSLVLTPHMGSINYTQTSANEFATFSKHATFDGMSYGLDFAVSKKWSLFTEWTQRNIKDHQDIALQQDNFELGTKVTW